LKEFAFGDPKCGVYSAFGTKGWKMHTENRDG